MSVSADEFDLQEYLPYLLNRAGIRFADAFCEILRPYDIGIGMWRVLAVVRRRPNIRMGELASATSIEISTLSRQVSGMEMRGLVKRGRSREDARAVEVVLTAKGQRIADEVVPQANSCQEVLIQGLAAEEIEQLRYLLDKIFQNSGELAVLSRGGPGTFIESAK